MDKKERYEALKKCKAQTWYTFCLVEASHDKEEEISMAKLAVELNISVPTLKKYIAAWESIGLIHTIPGGFSIAQIDGVADGKTGQAQERKFKKAKDVLDLWCKLYSDQYNESYRISNYGMALKQLKALLQHPDTSIEGGIVAAITLYDSKWKTAQFPRPTIGQMASWLFQQALPYADVAPKADVVAINENLLNDLEAKGWI
jgi:hypothetical protein